MHPPRAHSISPHIPQNLTLSSQTYNKRPQLFYKFLFIYFTKTSLLLLKIGSFCDTFFLFVHCRRVKPADPFNIWKSNWWCLWKESLMALFVTLLPKFLNEKQSLQFWNIIFIDGEGQEFPFCGSILHTNFFRSGQLQYDKLWDLNGCCVAAVLQHK